MSQLLPKGYGYYLYRGRTFATKLDALSTVWADGGRVDEIRFYFNDAAYADMSEPTESLASLYRARAMQLREQYDYLILMYSGGADSHQALMAFIHSGTYLDEVRTHCPMGFAARAPASKEFDSITKFSRQVLVGLDLVGTMCPGTKIVATDWTETLTKPWSENWLGELCPWPKPNGALYNAIRRNWEAMDLQRHADRQHGKRVAVIYGTEKPYMRLIGDDVYLFFTDVARVGLYNYFVPGVGEPLFTPEMFYWGVSWLPIKQAHVIKRALERMPNALDFVRATRCNIYPDTGIPGIDLSLIYPDWLRQKSAKVSGTNTEIISHFIDRPVKEFTELRRRHFQTLFRASDADDFMGVTSSALHHIGKLNVPAAQDLDPYE